MEFSASSRVKVGPKITLFRVLFDVDLDIFFSLFFLCGFPGRILRKKISTTFDTVKSLLFSLRQLYQIIFFFWKTTWHFGWCVGRAYHRYFLDCLQTLALTRRREKVFNFLTLSSWLKSSPIKKPTQKNWRVIFF